MGLLWLLPRLAHVVETQLHGVVTVLLPGLHLEDSTRTCPDDGDRDVLSVLGEHTGHPDLLAEDRLLSLPYLADH